MKNDKIYEKLMSRIRTALNESVWSEWEKENVPHFATDDFKNAIAMTLKTMYPHVNGKRLSSFCLGWQKPSGQTVTVFDFVKNPVKDSAGIEAIVDTAKKLMGESYEEQMSHTFIYMMFNAENKLINDFISDHCTINRDHIEDNEYMLVSKNNNTGAYVIRMTINGLMDNIMNFVDFWQVD